MPAPVHRNWTEFTCDPDVAHHLDHKTLQVGQKKKKTCAEGEKIKTQAGLFTAHSSTAHFQLNKKPLVIEYLSFLDG